MPSVDTSDEDDPVPAPSRRLCGRTRSELCPGRPMGGRAGWPRGESEESEESEVSLEVK